MTDQLLEDLRTLAMVNYGHFTSMRVDGDRVRGLSPEAIPEEAV